MDDKYMTSYFDQEIECTQEVLRIILGDEKGLTVHEVHTQQAYGLPNRREIRLDIIATDHTGKFYNIEIQREDAGADPKRARFHSSMIDTHGVPKSTEWGDFPDVYIIFITEHDVFQGGLARYTIARQIQELGQPFEDGVHIIYVNTEIKEDSELGRLMEDFLETDPAKMHNPILAERAHYLKETERGIFLMYSTWNDIYEEGREEGRAAGLTESLLKSASILKELGVAMQEAIAKLCEKFTTFTEDFIRDLITKNWASL